MPLRLRPRRHRALDAARGLRSFWRQHRRFGYGDGESGVQISFYARIAAKYGIALDLLVAGLWWRPAWWALLAGLVLFVLSQARRGR